MRESVEFTDSTGTTLPVYRWAPESDPRAVVMIVHGMGEHVLRYDHVAAALTAAGVAVYGYDQRGHGAGIGEGVPGEIGEAGWSALVDDIAEVARWIRQREPGLPIGVFAHSMGSFATQQVLPAHSDAFDAVALSGTAAIDILEPALDLDAPLDLAVFNAPFEPRTGFEWLSRDDAAVDAYVADPLCGFGLDGEASRAMFIGARPLADPAELARIRPDLPLYIAVGDQDPVNGGLALFTPLVDRLRDAGVADVTTHVYSGARHEIVNETNRAEVIGDLVEWLCDRLIGSPEGSAD
ncbi:alpha/beta fold hydrolase [Williamsia herbipolensis]|uniref:alpha/beta fold hydrolase n=1 Tax=Williamsia herbipolensis TaxID=1603258 RepID=UPI001EEFF626|nr:alpha/beta fold hydrolase [Williamsia herbipolensis]